MKAFTIRQEGTHVLLIVDGRCVLDVPWEAAEEVAKALTAKARAAEEIARHELVIRDQAILLRLGVPLGLTNHPILQREAGKLAAWDSDLRRKLPGGVRSRETFGTPALVKHRKR